jgi:hypothetical protein
METWTLSQIQDPNLLQSLKSDISGVTGLVDLELSDGKIRVSKRQAFMNLFWWPILSNFNIPLRKDHFIKYKPFDADSLTAEWNRYYDEIMVDSHNAKKLKQVLWNVISNMYIFGFEELIPYAATLDAIDLAEIANDKPMKDIIDTKDKINEMWSTAQVEKYINVHNEEIMKLLGERGGLKNDALLSYQRIGQLSAFQVPQTLYCFGIRTDINDNIVKKPVKGNVVDGLRDAVEFAVESLSAKKSKYYNRNSVANSQYFNRQMQLVSISLEHVYDGDCGTTQTVSFNITETNYKQCVGKYIVEDGKLVLLNKSNLKNYIGKEVHLRSPLTCKYRKGVCEVCGGRIYSNINRKLNVGYLSAIHLVSPVTQKILSAKHLIRTSSIIYELQREAERLMMMVNTSEIHWYGDWIRNLDKVELGVPVECFWGFRDVQLLRTDGNTKKVNERRISQIERIYLRNTSTGKLSEFNMRYGELIPSFDIQMLLHIRDNFSKIYLKDGVYWIPLAGTERLAIFSTPVINDNMRDFVDSVAKFFKSNVAKYGTNEDALSALADLVYGKVSINITHLETVLKAFQITSKVDYRIPYVEDTNDVMFATLAKILTERHVGTKLAYQQLKDYVSDPRSYLVLKQRCQMDVDIGCIK